MYTILTIALALHFHHEARSFTDFGTPWVYPFTNLLRPSICKKCSNTLVLESIEV